MEPRQAFGSGSHESTQLVLLMLEDLPIAGRRVLDVGTGSGILALAARALGAARPPLAADERGGLGLCSRRTCRCWWTFADSA